METTPEDEHAKGKCDEENKGNNEGNEGAEDLVFPFTDPQLNNSGLDIASTVGRIADRLYDVEAIIYSPKKTKKVSNKYIKVPKEHRRVPTNHIEHGVRAVFDGPRKITILTLHACLRRPFADR